MTTRTRVHALGAEGWFTLDGEPALIGSRCTSCGTFLFPEALGLVRQPRLPRHRVRRRAPVAPRARSGPTPTPSTSRHRPTSCPATSFEPFAIAAVELADEGLVVLGQVVPGVGVDQLKVGDEVELTVGTLFSDDDHDYQIWRWQPVASEGASA